MEIDSQRIKNYLSTEFIGSEIYLYDKVGSTNDIAKGLAVNGCKEGAVVIADSQSKGRGRLGRKWESPAGVGIYLSIILKPERVIPQLTLVAGVSVAEAINRIADCRLQIADFKNPKSEIRNPKLVCVSLKWPNDILINGKKAGGILTEAISRGKIVIVGIGINVNNPTSSPLLQGGEWGGEGFPDELKDKATSIMIETGNRTDRNLLTAELLNKFEYWYRRFVKGGVHVIKIIKRWKELSDTLGHRKVKVNLGDKVFDGVALDLENDGSLLIQLNDGSLKKISAGEVCY
ncbi:MAG: biotin--[acetyl-CoA-carboxylase] ligase [Nitrospinae bacterium]|nr:biotin--[acetyl-CoA-carboxylase] ligase [Nitrospinota bacterium]